MARLQLAGFAVPDPSDYDALAAIADALRHLPSRTSDEN